MSIIPEYAAKATPQSSPTTSSEFLIATDGTPDSDGAVRVGRALAQRDGATAKLFSVVEAPPFVNLDGTPVPDVDHLVAIAREERVTTLLAQRDRTHPGSHEWPFTVEVGPRVETIVERSRQSRTTLILLGLGAHGVGARLSFRETALRVIRTADTPVLALPSDAWGVPHSVLVATDFTASSERAARAALDLLGGEGTLYIAHVTARGSIPQGDSRTWDEVVTGTVLPKLHELTRALAPARGVKVEYVLLHGDPAARLLAFAEQRRVGPDSRGRARSLCLRSSGARQRLHEAGAQCEMLRARRAAGRGAHTVSRIGAAVSSRRLSAGGRAR